MESNRRKRMKRRREDECKRGPKLASTSKPRKDIGGMVDIDIFDPERKQRPSKKISTESSGCPNLNISHPSHHSPEEMYNKALALLRQTFQHQSLRNLQDRAVRGALQKKSQIIVLATGGGKSLCYQLPALVSGHNFKANIRADQSSVTIVITPLIALMLDQVNNLNQRGVRTAAYISSSQTAKEKNLILNRLRCDAKGRSSRTESDRIIPIKLLYCTPELIETERFRAILIKLHRMKRLQMFAVDEAHCLSTWGHDFRKSYRKLTWLRQTFPSVPVLAATGTATAKVIDDIRDVLKLDRRSCQLLMGSFNRPNISYEVRFKDSLNAKKSKGALLDLIGEVRSQHEGAKEPRSGIIYVHKREDCEAIAKEIRTTEISCLAYHAGLKDAERAETQKKWTEGTCQVVVATVAFGMGVDLPHVRYVIHWTMAKSLEGFYQESGRGGRDGREAKSIVYFSKDDASLFAFLVKKNAERKASKEGAGVQQQRADQLVEIESMARYCQIAGCKRQFVLAHFGETIDAATVCKKTCDYCRNPGKVSREIQASECMSAVVGSRKMSSQQKEKKYHHNPLDDEDEKGADEDYFGSIDASDDLGVFSYQPDDAMPQPPKSCFVKASAVIGHYQKLEIQEAQPRVRTSMGGFVNFKMRQFEKPTEEYIDAKRGRAEIPEHLRARMPDPHAADYEKAAQAKAEQKSSSAYKSEAERLRAELEELERMKVKLMGQAGLSTSLPKSKSISVPMSINLKKKRS
ncbi:hypothetical protein THAOC_37057 [Thalassiosira oceanica]|uniref:ATP-dependent DNA helicase n=1 Tax=Thalassiosira oceanica TaxID=159749 RepID=K0QZ91_THAOC|nr:hypothetical protein THAOC_37057 [Thalassiosira oceanica]|eukprot:EJK44405.1 hypothetical protein THAOC_37057 [Thalassiosira oceanica]